MVNCCKEKGLQYTGKIVQKNIGKPYLLKDSNELNILADWMENCLDLRYTTSLINCLRKTQVFDAVCKYTINLAFNTIQPLKRKI